MILTAQDIHEAFNQTLRDKYPDDQKISFSTWEDISEESRDLYVRLAELLNEKIQQNANSN